MNTEQVAEFNRKCAEYMWPGMVAGTIGGKVYGESAGDLNIAGFDPYHDANDRNKVLEKMRIKTAPFNKNIGRWQCSGITEDTNKGHEATGGTMEAAQIACISAVLGM